MPSTSQKQHNFMAAVANNPAFAKKAGVPQSVGEEFTKADKGKKFGTGTRADSQAVNQPKTNHGEMALFKRGGIMKETMGPRTMSMDVEKGSNKKTKFGQSAVQKRGMTKGTNLGDSGKTAPFQTGMKKGGGVKKMATGGMTSMGKVKAGGIKPHGEHSVQEKGKTRAKQISMPGNKGMKSGGSAKKYC